MDSSGTFPPLIKESMLIVIIKPKCKPNLFHWKIVDSDSKIYSDIFAFTSVSAGKSISCSVYEVVWLTYEPF